MPAFVILRSLLRFDTESLDDLLLTHIVDATNVMTKVFLLFILHFFIFLFFVF